MHIQDKIRADQVEEVRESILVAFGNEEDELMTDIAVITAMLDDVRINLHTAYPCA